MINRLTLGEKKDFIAAASFINPVDYWIHCDEINEQMYAQKMGW